MTIDNNTPNADGSQSTTGSPPARPTSLPPNCDPDRFLNWRFKVATHLVDHAGGSPVTHADPWVQAMIDFRIVSQLHHRLPTQTDLGVYKALELLKSDTLAKHILEARLLAQETPDEIGARCTLSPLVITAYSMLFFDVCGIERKGIWLLRPFASAVIANTEVAQFGWRLKQLACFGSSEELEGYISTLQRIEGKTLADGCFEDGDVRCIQDMQPRLALARMLLPMSRSTEKELNQFLEAAASDVKSGRTSQGTFDLANQVLRKVKVPVLLQRELRSMREAIATNRITADAVKA